jgi:hypothetical protein
MRVILGDKAQSCTTFPLSALNLIGQLVVRTPACFVRSLVPRRLESPLIQHVLVGFVVTLLVGLVIVVAAAPRIA